MKKSSRHQPGGWGCSGYNMRSFEYYDCIPDSLRQFKAEIFHALGHPTPSPSSEQLKDVEITAGGLVERLGVEQANLSQHLSVLRARQIVVTRKAGNQVFYSVRDPLILDVLALMRRYFHKQLRIDGDAGGDEEDGERQTLRRSVCRISACLRRLRFDR